MSWKDQIEKLQIPYPEKVRLLDEISAHIEYRPEEGQVTFQKEELEELYDVHNTKVLKVLETLPSGRRAFIEVVFASAPIAVLLIYLMEESFMTQFMHEGGPGMYAILTIGLALLVRELLLIQKVIVLKDHSPKNFRIDTMTVMIGTVALVLLGFTATGFGAYKAAFWVESQNLPASILIQGLKESLTCLTLSTLLSTFILFLHFFTRRMLIRWRVPSASFETL